MLLARSAQPEVQHMSEPVHWLPPLHLHDVPTHWLPLVHAGLHDDGTHTPIMHASMPQFFAQVPQCDGVFERSKQPSGQQVWLPRHTVPPAPAHAQLPPAHDSPAWQLWPHMPQLLGSPPVLVHAAPQQLWPSPHATPPQLHAPVSTASPGATPRPH